MLQDNLIILKLIFTSPFIPVEECVSRVVSRPPLSMQPGPQGRWTPYMEVQDFSMHISRNFQAH